jgi:hypothetical protein
MKRADRELVALVNRAALAALDVIPEEAPTECLVAIAATFITTYCVNTGTDEREALEALRLGVESGLAAHYAEATRGRA